MRMSIIVSLLLMLCLMFYYVRMRKNKKHDKIALGKLHIALVTSAVFTGVVFMGVS